MRVSVRVRVRVRVRVWVWVAACAASLAEEGDDNVAQVGERDVVLG